MNDLDEIPRDAQSRDLHALQVIPQQLPPTHVADLPALMQLASQLVPTGFLPDHIKTPGQAVAIILSGRELGIGPMLALRSIYMVKGKIELSADLQLSLFKRDGGKAQFTELTEQRATLKLTHPNGDVHTEAFTADDAKRAGLNGDNWRKYPKAMLRSRVITAGLKSLGFEPKMSGCYAPGEIGGPETIVDVQTLREMEAEKLALQQKEIEAAKAEQKPNGKRNHQDAIASFTKWLYEHCGTEVAGWCIAYLRGHTPDGDDKNAALMPNEDLTALSENSLAAIRKDMVGFLARLKAFAEQNKPKPTAQDVLGMKEGEQKLSGIIIGISSKPGETGKKKWVLYGIQIGDPSDPDEKNEVWLNTFSKTLYTEAERLKGENVTVFYTENDKGKTCTAIVSSDGIVRAGESKE